MKVDSAKLWMLCEGSILEAECHILLEILDHVCLLSLSPLRVDTLGSGTDQFLQITAIECIREVRTYVCDGVVAKENEVISYHFPR